MALVKSMRLTYFTFLLGPKTLHYFLVILFIEISFLGIVVTREVHPVVFLCSSGWYGPSMEGLKVHITGTADLSKQCASLLSPDIFVLNLFFSLKQESISVSSYL